MSGHGDGGRRGFVGRGGPEGGHRVLPLRNGKIRKQKNGDRDTKNKKMITELSGWIFFALASRCPSTVMRVERALLREADNLSIDRPSQRSLRRR